MAAPQGEWTSCHRTVHLNIGEMVNFMSILAQFKEAAPHTSINGPEGTLCVFLGPCLIDTPPAASSPVV